MKKMRKQILTTSSMALKDPQAPGWTPSIATFLPQGIEIHHGKVRFIDHKVSQPRTLTTTFNNLDLSLKGINGSKVIKFDLSAEPYPLEKSRIYLKGEIILPPARLDLKKSKLNIDIKLNKFSLAPFSPYIQTAKPQFLAPLISANINSDLQLIGRFSDSLVLQGKLELLYFVPRREGTLKGFRLRSDNKSMKGAIPELRTERTEVTNSELSPPSKFIPKGKDAKRDPVKLTLQGRTSWDFLRDVLRLEGVNLNAAGVLSVKAHGLLKGIRRFSHIDITLNSPAFFPSKIIPLIYPLPRLTIEGKSSCMLKISGAPNKIEITGSLDLSKNNIEYSHLFEKISHVPFKTIFRVVTDKDILEFKKLEVRLDRLNLKGTLKLSQFQDPLVQVNMDFTRFDLAGTDMLFPPIKIYKLSGLAEGGFSLEGKIRELNQIGLDSEVYLQEAKITIPQNPLKIKKLEDITGFIYFAENSLNFKDLSLRAGNSSFTLNTAKWEGLNHKPKISFDVQGLFLDLDELIFLDKVPLFPQDQRMVNTESDQQTRIPKHHKADRRKTYSSFLHRYNAMGKIRQEKTKIRGIYLKDLSVNIALQEGNLTWSGLRFSAFDGDIGSIGAIDFNKVIPEYQLTGSLSQLKLIPLLESFTTQGKTLSGKLSSDFKLGGKGFVKDSIHQELTGTGTFHIVHGKIAHLNILEKLAEREVLNELVRWEKSTGKKIPISIEPYTDFDELSGKWKIVRAKISFEDLIMQNSDLTISNKGIVGFDQSLNFKGSSFLSSKRTNRLIREDYRSFLTDRRGRLEIPFTILGTIEDPIVTPDLLYLSRRVFKAYKEHHKGKKGKHSKGKTGKEIEKIIEDIFQGH
jgi:hypothetical protein